MQKLKPIVAGLQAVIVTIMLCGAPQIAGAQQNVAPPQSQDQQPPAAGQNIPPAETPSIKNSVPSPNGSDVDPSKGPLEPVPPAEGSQQQPLPDAPTANSQPIGTPQAPSVPMANAPEQQKPAGEPVGTATAERTPTAGGAASKPAGTAIAPAKQRQLRSLVLKLGALAGAGIALGTVYALSQRTPSVPPGAHAITH